MAIKPSQNWRAGVAQEARDVASGELDPGCAFMDQLFPDSLLEATEATLRSFEADVHAWVGPSDELVFGAVRRVVLALNSINEEHGGAGYETGEREDLCAYIDRTLTEHGIDVPALAARNGMGAHEITDEWRDW
ncbi:hypothetical protein [Streptomyces lushanensis]|uniref:hypothetical protein n=1 Tax=Streptomyces lushanensis TaxID=1434255 RepID=UPI00082D7EE5|nr:hypothetical protein [Streptomyces lushanensis]